MNRKKVKQWMHEGLLLLIVTAIVLGSSYAFIAAGPYVETTTHIWLYAAAMFLVLPIAAYAAVSCCMWLLDKLFAQ